MTYPTNDDYLGDEAALPNARDRNSNQPSSSASQPPSSRSVSPIGPLAMVETAFLASTASLIWLVNYYFPAGPLLRIFFPLPISMVYLRWGGRSAWMSALVSGLLLSVLMGPPRSLLFFIPYGLLGVQLGGMWRRRSGWPISIAIGSIIGSFGFFFRLWLLSVLLGEDLWVYITTQVTQLIEWVSTHLVNFGLLGVGALGEPSLMLIQIVMLILVLISNIVYVFTVHLAAWLLLERLKISMPAPPQWVQVLLDE
ncbi:MAG: DUF2232 domain-containing protein [Thainema sp.]